MITDQQFMHAAALLKRHAAPDAWANFLGAFEAYTYNRIGEVADAPLDVVVLHQGMARQCKRLFHMLRECEPKPRGDTP